MKTCQALAMAVLLCLSTGALSSRLSPGGPLRNLRQVNVAIPGLPALVDVRGLPVIGSVNVGGASSSAVGVAVNLNGDCTQACWDPCTVTSDAIAAAAARAVANGKKNAFAEAQAFAFAEAKSRGCLDYYTTVCGEAMSKGGSAAAEAFAAAFATCSAKGGVFAAAAAEAAAKSYGGAYAQSYALAAQQAGCKPINDVATYAGADAFASGGSAAAFSSALASSSSGTYNLCVQPKSASG